MKSYIRNFTNIFRRYKNPYLSLERRFVTPDQKSVKFIDKYNSLVDERVQSKSKMSAVKFATFVAINNCDLLANSINNYINDFTLDSVSDSQFQEKTKTIKKRLPQILEILIDERRHLFIETEDMSYRVRRISEYFPEFYKNNPVITTEDRAGQCHLLAPKFVMNTNLEMLKLSTGPVYVLSPKATYLHSFVETFIDGEPVVIDPTKNLIINKEAYYFLHHIDRKPEKIFKEDLMKEAHMVRDMCVNYSPIFSKLYLSSREEALEIARKFYEKQENKSYEEQGAR